MSGTKMQAATVITVSEFLLATASHIVKLTVGLVLEGMRNGNNEKPAVKIAPVTASEVPRKLKPALALPAAAITINAPKIAIIGAIIVIG